MSTRNICESSSRWRKALSNAIFCILTTSVYMHGGSQQSQSCASRNSRRLTPPTWSDDMLYSVLGQRRDSFIMMSQSGIAKFTADAQTLLIRHQFPTSCKGKKFLVSYGNDRQKSGIGSHMHISGSHLGIALDQDRIFLWGSDVLDTFTDAETCGSDRNALCFFQPPSSCSLADTQDADVKYLYHGMALQQEGLPWHHVPSPMRALWTSSGEVATDHEIKYWWRGQSVAFLMRFNDRSVGLLRSLRDVKMLHHPNGTSADNSPRMHPGSVSMHVRHGDKHKEMKLVQTQRYVDFAESMVVNNPLGLSRYAFVSSEDPSVFVDITDAEMAGQVPWKFVWYDMPRLNSNGLDQIAKLSIPAGRLTLIWLLQILIALECDAWVGTRGSNWNRLIDELRCIWVPKCTGAFVEVGLDNAHVNYDW